MRARLTLFGVLVVLVMVGFLLGARSAPAAPAEAGLAAAQTDATGAGEFAAECAGCHGQDGAGALEGPSLRSLLGTDEAVAGVAEIVRSGYGEMDSFEGELSDAEIEAVASYVVGEFGTQGDVPKGGTLYRVNCAGCHGATARGGALIYSENAPSLADASSPLVAAAVRGGPSTMPAYNEGALTDAQVAAISAYVEALREPPQPGGMEVPFQGPVTEGWVAIFLGLGATMLAALWMERGGRG